MALDPAAHIVLQVCGRSGADISENEAPLNGLVTDQALEEDARRSALARLGERIVSP